MTNAAPPGAVSGTKAVHTLWSWDAVSEGGSLQRISKQLALPSAPHSLHPACAPSLRPQPAAAATESNPRDTTGEPKAMEVDSSAASAAPAESEATQAAVVIAFLDGSVALCTYAAGALSLSSTTRPSEGAGRLLAVAANGRGGLAVVQGSVSSEAAKPSPATYTATWHERQVCES